MSFKENINRICKERDTTLTAVVKEVKNGATSYVTAINKKGSIPNQDELEKFAKQLNCTVADFFIDGDVSHTNIYSASGDNSVNIGKLTNTISKEETEIIKIFRKLTKRNKYEFMLLIYDFAEKHGVEI